MNSSIVDFVNAYPELFVQQKKEWIEIVVDWETGNKYAILDPNKNPLGYMAEESGGFWNHIKRVLLRSHRPFLVRILNPSGHPLLKLNRAFFWFFSDLDVVDSEGSRLGSVHRRFGIIYKKYDLKDATGQIFARISSPIWRWWTFPILDTTGEPRAVISKRWGGALREIFTDADTYRVEFGMHPWTWEQRAIIFAASVSIDFDFFENNQGKSGGVFSLFD